MLFLENIRLALHALRINKMRALLTMLGIIIGIGSVIAILTISTSLSHSISDSFAQMGANNITVGLKQTSDTEESRANGMTFGKSGRSRSISESDKITDDMLTQLAAAYPDEIDAIALSEQGDAVTATNSNGSASLSLTGINEDYKKSTSLTLLAGRYLTEADNTGKKHVVMLSDKAAISLFENYRTALRENISLSVNGNYETFYIVGIYKYESDGSISSDSDENTTTTAYLPLLTLKDLLDESSGYTTCTVVTTDSVSSLSSFADTLEQFFVPFYRTNEDYEIAATTMESLTESMTDTVSKVALAISFIASISLLVGGIGVMNIMLVSITERTREIGIRKALGAKNSSIRLQFITESTVLCLIGGILGVVIGLLSGSIISSIMGYQAQAPFQAIALCVLCSMIIGLFFGLYPAEKAAKQDPIDALRYE